MFFLSLRHMNAKIKSAVDIYFDTSSAVTHFYTEKKKNLFIHSNYPHHHLHAPITAGGVYPRSFGSVGSRERRSQKATGGRAQAPHGSAAPDCVGPQP